MKHHQQKFVLRHGSDEDVERVLSNPSRPTLENFPFLGDDENHFTSSLTKYAEHPVLSRQNLNIPTSFYHSFGQVHQKEKRNIEWLAKHPKTPKGIFKTEEEKAERIPQSEVERNLKKLKEGTAGRNGHQFLANPSVSDYQLNEFLDHPASKKYIGFIGKNRKFMPVAMQEKLFKMDPASIVENEHLHPVAQNAVVNVVANSTGDTSKFEGLFHRKDLSKSNVNKLIASGRHAFKMAARDDLDPEQQEAILKAKSKGLEPSKGFVFRETPPSPKVLEKVRLMPWVHNPKDTDEHAFAFAFWDKLKKVRPLDQSEEKKMKTSEALADDKTLSKIKKRSTKGFS